MEITTILVFLSCLISLIFLATVAWALIQINKQLSPIGGTPESFLAIEGGLEQLANNLKSSK